MQDKNNKELHYSNAKVVDARSRSPAKDRTYQRSSPKQSRESYAKPARGGSPLRSSYKATYNY
jgi:hypothetical protein